VLGGKKCIGFVIVTPTICVIGMILNLLCFIVFLRLKEKIFFYLAIKSLAESLLLVTGAISPYVLCITCNLENTYLRALITLILSKYILLCTYTFITLLEIEIAFNRYYLISSHSTKTLTETKDKVKAFVYILVSIIIFVPYFFAYKINKHEINVFLNIIEYKMEENQFGNSDLFYYVYTYYGLFLNIISILILLPLNIMIIIKFRKFIQQKLRTSALNAFMRQENIKTETRFTRMMVLLSFLFIFTRLVEMSILIFSLYNLYVKLIDYYEFYFIVLNTYVYASTYLIFSLNFFIFYIFNQTFRSKFKETFKCC